MISQFLYHVRFNSTCVGTCNVSNGFNHAHLTRTVFGPRIVDLRSSTEAYKHRHERSRSANPHTGPRTNCCLNHAKFGLPLQLGVLQLFYPPSTHGNTIFVTLCSENNTSTDSRVYGSDRSTATRFLVDLDHKQNLTGSQ